jgi:hypothetical protein
VIFREAVYHDRQLYGIRKKKPVSAIRFFNGTSASRLSGRHDATQSAHFTSTFAASNLIMG